MTYFNHAYTVAFSLNSEDPDAKDVTPAMLRDALLRRIASLDTAGDVEWLEACDAPYDTYEEGTDFRAPARGGPCSGAGKSDMLHAVAAAYDVDVYDDGKPWQTPIGQDCVDLCTSLPRWLGERLIFLANHTNGCPVLYYDMHEGVGVEVWKLDLLIRGWALIKWADAGAQEEALADAQEDEALAGAQEALRWVADNLHSLWD